MPTGERTVAEFVRNVYDKLLSLFWLHQYEADHYVLMENGVPIHRSIRPKYWREQIGLPKLN